jgi:hypothetical protein
MTTHHLLRSVGLTALLLTSLAAPSATLAQDPTIGGVRDRAPAARVARTRPRGPIEDVLARPQPRYRVEAVSFRAVAESPPARLGSDEVSAMFYDFGRDVIAKTNIVENVDSGDIHNFGPHESCIVPIEGSRTWPENVHRGSWSCGGIGAGPLEFGVVLIEHDDFPGGWHDGVGTARALFENPLLDSDDELGRATVSITPAQLAAWLPNPGFTRIQEIVLLPPCLQTSSVCGGPMPDYRLTYKLTRLPDYVPDQPLVAGRR